MDKLLNKKGKSLVGAVLNTNASSGERPQYQGRSPEANPYRRRKNEDQRVQIAKKEMERARYFQQYGMYPEDVKKMEQLQLQRNFYEKKGLRPPPLGNDVRQGVYHEPNRGFDHGHGYPAQRGYDNFQREPQYYDERERYRGPPGDHYDEGGYQQPPQRYYEDQRQQYDDRKDYGSYPPSQDYPQQHQMRRDPYMDERRYHERDYEQYDRRSEPIQRDNRDYYPDARQNANSQRYPEERGYERMERGSEAQNRGYEAQERFSDRNDGYYDDRRGFEMQNQNQYPSEEIVDRNFPERSQRGAYVENERGRRSYITSERPNDNEYQMDDFQNQRQGAQQPAPKPKPKAAPKPAPKASPKPKVKAAPKPKVKAAPKPKPKTKAAHEGKATPKKKPYVKPPPSKIARLRDRPATVGSVEEVTATRPKKLAKEPVQRPPREAAPISESEAYRNEMPREDIRMQPQREEYNPDHKNQPFERRTWSDGAPPPRNLGNFQNNDLVDDFDRPMGPPVRGPVPLNTRQPKGSVARPPPSILPTLRPKSPPKEDIYLPGVFKAPPKTVVKESYRETAIELRNREILENKSKNDRLMDKSADLVIGLTSKAGSKAIKGGASATTKFTKNVVLNPAAPKAAAHLAKGTVRAVVTSKEKGEEVTAGKIAASAVGSMMESEEGKQVIRDATIATVEEEINERIGGKGAAAAGKAAGNMVSSLMESEEGRDLFMKTAEKVVDNSVDVAQEEAKRKRNPSRRGRR